jgi:hypothetical protein
MLKLAYRKFENGEECSTVALFDESLRTKGPFDFDEVIDEEEGYESEATLASSTRSEKEAEVEDSVSSSASTTGSARTVPTGRSVEAS